MRKKRSGRPLPQLPPAPAGPLPGSAAERRVNMQFTTFQLRKKMRVVGRLDFKPDVAAVRERLPGESAKGLWENVATFSVTLRQGTGKRTPSQPPLCRRGHLCEVRTTLPEVYGLHLAAHPDDAFESESARFPQCEKCGEEDPQPQEPFFHCAECAIQYVGYDCLNCFDLCNGCSWFYVCMCVS